MIYKFVIDYTPTDPAGVASQRVCSPTYGDDLSVNIEMESDEWYRKRKLEGKLTFLRKDYDWMMAQPFDGTFKLTVQSSNDGGATWQLYLEGTFSRANLEIDEDNQNVVLNGLNEGGEYNAIENGKDEEYDLMKIIPDADAKEVQGQVHPALAMVDYNNSSINHSDIFCDAAITAAGYNSDNPDSGFNVNIKVVSDSSWSFVRMCGEGYVKMKDRTSPYDGYYAGNLSYLYLVGQNPAYNKTCVGGRLDGKDGSYCYLDYRLLPYGPGGSQFVIIHTLRIYNSANALIATVEANSDVTNDIYSPTSIVFDYSSVSGSIVEKVELFFHYIRATLLTQSGGNADNVLDTGDYYKRMAAFNNQDGGLVIVASANTVEQPNGHRLVPGTGEQGTTPQYFAPPDNTAPWIPLAEYGWQYASMWYTIVPSVSNGLLDSTKVGSFRWTRCWTLGTCLDKLLRKITNNKVTFDQSVAGSEFLYSTVNPLTQGEPFEYLFTQKSNVMRPSVGGESAARCIVRLEWFLEFLRNALNCYWWLDERNGGTYAFRVEHVEWFRRGGSYTGHLGDDDQIFDLTKIKPLRNFPRNGEAAKRLDNQLHKYSYEMNGMTEKYLFSWQGDGGSDAFKGNPMFFKAGWVEKGTSESKEVDNIFADLSWLMLNAGSDTASSKNYEGIFVFSGYKADVDGMENTTLMLSPIVVPVDVIIWATIPVGEEVRLVLQSAGSSQVIAIYQGTDGVQPIIVPYVQSRGDIFKLFFNTITVRRVHALTGNVYNVPNVLNRLTEDGYLQNGPLAWPWLQCEFLHYDVPAKRWGYRYDDLDALDSHGAWETDGTVKMRKKQEVPLLPLPTKSDEEDLDKGVIGGLKDSQGQLQTGIVKSATINLGTRNAKVTLMYDMIS